MNQVVELNVVNDILKIPFYPHRLDDVEIMDQLHKHNIEINYIGIYPFFTIKCENCNKQIKLERKERFEANCSCGYNFSCSIEYIEDFGFVNYKIDKNKDNILNVPCYQCKTYHKAIKYNDNYIFTCNSCGILHIINK